MQTQIITVTENEHQFIRIDTLDLAGNEKLISVLNIPISAIDQLITKLQELKTQVAPKPQQVAVPYPVIPLQIIREAVTPEDDEAEEHPVMTAVLGPKPNPTDWYKNALQKEAVKPAEVIPVKRDIIEETPPPMPQPKRGKNIINIIGVRSKDHVQFGMKYEGKIDPNKNADIIKNESIRIYGLEKGRVRYDQQTKQTTHYTLAYDITFKIGDEAVYGSYNLVYTGKIIKIGEKTVTIAKGHGDRNKQLDIDTFISRNYDYDAQKIFERNSNWYD